ncbi:uncharacterized protein LOC126745968 [Anthonomus grandis grandis]|uniref:uncharacterized protein LOC126745968 n=1 Tax=Anthonomus grandis grandis TaxID=2921223 RepID=UPI0021667D36|nr:uncharacterized protein LOC126745968 [Anthonomus grandis grandis]
MKTAHVLLFICAYIGGSFAIIPDYLQPLVCKTSDPEYEKCIWNSFEQSRPYLMKGIPELNLPPMDPFILPLMTVNRTLNDVVSINAVCRNIRVEGGRNVIINDVKADPIKHTGEIRLTLPWAYLEMEYDVSGKLLTIPLQSKGFFKGNITDTKFYVKGALETFKKDDGEEYFKVKKIVSKIVSGGGWIRLTSKNPNLQFGADIISNFFNENPRRVMDTVNPIFVETSNELFRVVADQILANMKVSEWLPKEIKMNHIGTSALTITILFLLVIETCYGQKSKRPSYFPTCYRNDPKLNQCLLDATETLRPYLAKGVPELSIPPFEPFKIPQIKLEQGTRALNFKAVLDNVVVHGLTNYKFSKFDFDVPNYQFFCNAVVDKLSLEGNYQVNGRILIAPIEGNGKFNAEIDSADVFVYQKYKEGTLKDGKIHLIPVTTNSSIEVRRPRAHLDGLFSGNEELNAATNKAINDNVDMLFEDLKPVVEHTLSRILEDVLLKSIIDSIPWDELYPVNPAFNK